MLSGEYVRGKFLNLKEGNCSEYEWGWGGRREGRGSEAGESVCLLISFCCIFSFDHWF